MEDSKQLSDDFSNFGNFTAADNNTELSITNNDFGDFSSSFEDGNGQAVVESAKVENSKQSSNDLGEIDNEKQQTDINSTNMQDLQQSSKDISDFGNFPATESSTSNDFGDFGAFSDDEKKEPLTAQDKLGENSEQSCESFGNFENFSAGDNNAKPSNSNDFGNLGGSPENDIKQKKTIESSNMEDLQKSSYDFDDFKNTKPTNNDFGDFGDFSENDNNAESSANNDFGDFGGFSENEKKTPVTMQATQDDNLNQPSEGFGDFGNFSTNDNNTESSQNTDFGDFGNFSANNDNVEPNSCDFGDFSAKSSEKFGDFASQRSLDANNIEEKKIEQKTNKV